MDVIEYTIDTSDFGNIILIARNGRLIELDIVPEEPLYIRKRLHSRYPDAKEQQKPFRAVLKALDGYFKHQRVKFDIELDLDDLGAFTRAVLAEVSKVPYGHTETYSGIGRAIGYPHAPRAVGQALKRNPIPIIIPCHRIVKADGSLGGFDMGLEMKIRLLSIEGVRLNRFRNSLVSK